MGSSQAVQYHSITLTDLNTGSSRNTWDDWHIVPTSRPKFNMPPVKTNYLDIPGVDGALDLTASLIGRSVYGNRTGSFEFLVMNDYDDDDPEDTWSKKYSDIAMFLHGKEYQAILDDDPEFYYFGRFSVNEWKSDPHWSLIVIDYNVGPYKRYTTALGERWLWDPFDFGIGDSGGDEIIDFSNIVLGDDPVTINYVATPFELVPSISSSHSGVTVTFNGTVYQLNQGNNYMDYTSFVEGNNTLIFKSNRPASDKTDRIIEIHNTGGLL